MWSGVQAFLYEQSCRVPLPGIAFSLPLLEIPFPDTCLSNISLTKVLPLRNYLHMHLSNIELPRKRQCLLFSDAEPFADDCLIPDATGKDFLLSGDGRSIRTSTITP